MYKWIYSMTLGLLVALYGVVRADEVVFKSEEEKVVYAAGALFGY